MKKKFYVKPTAEYIAFYSDEEITADLPLGDIQTYANDGGSGTIMSGTMGEGTLEPGIPLD
jgi:hypothetical protein